MFHRSIFLHILVLFSLAHRLVWAEEKSSLSEFEIAPPDSYKVEIKKHPGAFSFDFGVVARTRARDSRGDWLTGLQYRHGSYSEGHWEGGLDILGDRLGAVHGGYRLIFDRDRQVRPHLKLAFASVPDKDEGLSGVLKSDNFRCRAGFALERDMSERIFFRFEGEGEFGGDRGAEAHFRFGLVWHLSAGVWTRPLKHRSPQEALRNIRRN